MGNARDAFWGRAFWGRGDAVGVDALVGNEGIGGDGLFDGRGKERMGCFAGEVREPASGA